MATTLRQARPTALGVGLTLASTAAFAWIGVLTQLGYDEGATVGTMLSGRFLIATALLWLAVVLAGVPRPDRRASVRALILGVGYATHAWLYSESLARLEAGLVDALLFTYPAIVSLGAIALHRDRWSGRRMLALGAAIGGAVLVLVGGLDNIDLTGAGLALGASAAYAAYILSSANQLERTHPLSLAALVATAAAVTLTIVAVVHHDLRVDVDATGLASIAAVGVVAVAGMTTFVAGIGLLGPSRASIISALQPALTAIVGLAIFADRPGSTQVLGVTLVVASVVILQAGRRARNSSLSSLPRRERRLLSRGAVTLHVPAGQHIVREGARPDQFFLIEQGHARVTLRDRPVADLGPGDFFGEMALLRGGTRTASVNAATDMRVRVLSRFDFSRAMKTLPALARLVQRLADERFALTPIPT